MELDYLDPKDRLRKFEKNFWFFGGVIIALWSLVITVFRELGTDYQRFWFPLFTLAFALFPVVFYLIFAELPFHVLREILYRLSFSSPDSEDKGEKATSTFNASAEMESNEVQRNNGPSRFSGLQFYAEESRVLASKIYNRSGVYLLIGTVIAISGLVFFYYQTPVISEYKDMTYLLLLLAPKFGILFFIEFVALFFLKQYRSAMDEFRYYESVARAREEVLCILNFKYSSGQTVDPMDLVRFDSYFSSGSILSSGQTTELIEARKSEKSDLEALAVLIKEASKFRA